jgi:hypothetical protein
MPRLRISSHDFPEAKRLSPWREIYGRTFFNNDVEPIGDAPFYAEAVLTSLPEVGISTSWRSPSHNHVTREHAKRGKNVAYVIILKRRTAAVTQLDRTRQVELGGAVVVMPDHPPGPARYWRRKATPPRHWRCRLQRWVRSCRA